MDEATRRFRMQSEMAQERALRDLLRLWPLLDLRNLNESFPQWLPLLATTIRRDREAAAGAAAAYMRIEYTMQVGRGEPRIALASSLPADQLAASGSAVTVAGYRKALRVNPSQAADIAMVRTAGMVTRMVLNAGRDTILESLKADPKGTGWRRVASSSACNFCTMLVGRGAVYSADTVNFSAHDHCKCSAEPVYGPITDPVYLNEPTRPRSGDTELALATLSGA